jgi:hypothetical protein
MKFNVHHTHSHISDEVSPLADKLYYIEVNLAVWAVCVDVSNVHVYTFVEIHIRQYARSLTASLWGSVPILYVFLSLNQAVNAGYGNKYRNPSDILVAECW